MATIDRACFQPLIDAGYIRETAHPTLPLSILNYTPKTQYEGRWTPETKAARGLIVEQGTDQIIARPFPKFFNLSEMGEGWQPAEGPVTVHQKWDGSLLIVAWYESAQEWIFATRGSFTSDQARKGWELWYDAAGKVNQYFNTRYTYLYEVIYPENRIVVDYGSDERVVLLAVIDTETGEDVWPDYAAAHRYDTVSEFHLALPELRQVPSGAEGWVIRFADGERVKIKGEEYVRLHRILTGVSERRIWEALQDGTIDTYLQNVPDEFYQWVKGVRARLLTEYHRIEQQAIRDYQAALGQAEMHAARFDPRVEARAFAEQAKTSAYPEIVFGLKAGKPYQQMIWKRIKPEVSTPYVMEEAA